MADEFRLAVVDPGKMSRTHIRVGQAPRRSCNSTALHAANGIVNRPVMTFRANNGGIVVDMGVHEHDQFRWLTWQKPVMLDPMVRRIADYCYRG
jgi:predicted dehydrogenase